MSEHVDWFYAQKEIFEKQGCSLHEMNSKYVQCTVYSVQCTVYSVQCTVYSVQFTVYSVQCTLQFGIQRELIFRYNRIVQAITL